MKWEIIVIIIAGVLLVALNFGTVPNSLFNLPQGERIERTLAIPSTAFNSDNPATDNVLVNYERFRSLTRTTATAPVFLPDGAVLKSAITYGDNAGLNWQLRKIRHDRTTGSTVIFSAAINTRDTSPAVDLTIDNENFTYTIAISNFGADGTDDAYGVVIKYTEFLN